MHVKIRNHIHQTMLNFKIIVLLSAPYLLGHTSQKTGTVKGRLPVTQAVPGNPQAEIAKFHTLSAVLSTYSKLHAGAYPPSGTDLLKEILRNMPAYGFHSFPQVLSLFRNPDAKFADDSGVRADPQSSLAFTLPQTRPDGSPKDKSKAPGLRDVEAYSDLYYHQNIKHYSGDRTVSRPTGFYIVL